ncbi:MAG: ATP-binding cassette domain-containing protein [Campylobacterales bacterium]|nr:ATP-binding cassette domain-containing protein [Campylobacterales bacterium]
MQNCKSDTVLSVENLTFGYTKDKLLYKDFNLELKKGEVVSIVGQSGSGKSTLFELIAGELKPFNGFIKKESFSWIYQDPYSSFHHSYTILNQIEDVAIIENLDEILNRLNLDKSFLYKKPFELSGGQLQRCSILRAVLMKPKLLLADEPTSALDNIISLDIMEMLVGFLDMFGILLITHDKELASWCSDKIINLSA